MYADRQIDLLIQSYSMQLKVNTQLWLQKMVQWSQKMPQKPEVDKIDT